jgi:hypothetical protein
MSRFRNHVDAARSMTSFIRNSRGEDRRHAHAQFSPTPRFTKRSSAVCVGGPSPTLTATIAAAI